MAHKKAGGSTSNIRDSRSKRLGVKRFGGEQIVAGGVIVRQRGTKFLAGDNTYLGRDYTIHAKVNGIVRFSERQKVCFDGSRRKATVVHVEAAA